MGYKLAMADKGTSIKMPIVFRDMIENARATRRSKMVGTDKKMLSQLDTINSLVQYFVKYPNSFKEWMRMEYEKDGF